MDFYRKVFRNTQWLYRTDDYPGIAQPIAHQRSIEKIQERCTKKEI